MERGKWVLELLSKEGELLRVKLAHEQEQQEKERRMKSQRCIVILSKSLLLCPGLVSDSCQGETELPATLSLRLSLLPHPSLAPMLVPGSVLLRLPC